MFGEYTYKTIVQKMRTNHESQEKIAMLLEMSLYLFLAVKVVLLKLKTLQVISNLN